MAIEMIEDNELGALAPSRLGLSEFVDDQWAYRNYTGSEDFFSLLGSRKKKVESAKSTVRGKFEDLPTDCASIQKSIDIVSNELQLLLKQRKKNINVKTQVDEANRFMAEFKRLQIEQDCVSKAAEAKAAKEKEDTLSTLTQLSDVSVSKAQSELAGAQQGAAGGDDTKKLLIYGGVGLAALVAIILITRR